PFQHRPYWLHHTPTLTNATDLGQTPTPHPLLAATAQLSNGAHLFTGRLSLATHPWLAHHTIRGTVVLPAAALVDLALHASHHTGHGGIGDLTLHTPLALAEGAAVRLRITVETANGDAPATLSIDSQPESDPESAWTTHASATLGLSPAEGVNEQPLSVNWPPREARSRAVDDLYEDLADVGLAYAPAFQGVRALWQHGDTLYVEVGLPEEPTLPDTAWDGFGVHPALLDAALHPLLRAHGDGGRTTLRWSGISLHAEPSPVLRVRLTPTADDTFAVEIADDTGAPVLTAGAVRLGPLPDSLPRTGRHVAPGDALFRVGWKPAAPESREFAPGTWGLLGEDLLGVRPALEAAGQVGRIGSYPDMKALLSVLDDVVPQSVIAPCISPEADDVAQAVHTLTERVLSLLQSWLAEPRLTASRLVVVTRGAVAASDTEKPDDLGAASVWGLLRSAQSENPDQFQLIDTDGTAASLTALPTVLTSGEPQVALREGKMLTPHLTKEPVAKDAVASALDPDGTVLITGGTGTLGALTARHLITQHGAR
ncbi:SpnB-like Rossmann fold domain-containing protein, partial [Streptomyces eurythermus]